MIKKPLIVLTGPTAAGKTELSLRLAEEIGAEIISADSMQVYRKMNIGTAKILPDQRRGIPHHLIDILDPADPFNVVLFRKLAMEAAEDILARGHIPLVVGGTGFYIQALLYDVDFQEQETAGPYREKLWNIYQEKGAQYLHDMLEQCDPDYAAGVHANNVKRVIRALEYYHETGDRLSAHNKSMREKTSPWNFAYFVLTHDRQILYDRINRRVAQMMEEGLLEEVTGLYKEGYTRNLISMQGIGYQEFFDYFEGKVSLAEVEDNIRKNTRHFAKRQLTWFRREKETISISRNDYENDEAILAAMLEEIDRRGIRND